jgi:enoyl-CoA hydratase/carnithine racemase
MGLFEKRPEVLADQSNPQELMAQLRSLEHLDVGQQEALDYVLTDWVMVVLSRHADIEGVIALFRLCRLAQACLDDLEGVNAFRIRWAGFADLLEARSLAIRARSAPQSLQLLQEPAIFAYLQQKGEVTQSELAKILQLSAGRISQVLAVLESRGQVARMRRGKESWVSLPTAPDLRQPLAGEAQRLPAFTGAYPTASGNTEMRANAALTQYVVTPVSNCPPKDAGDTPFILQSAAAGIATLTLNRPAQYNPLSSQMISALQSALDALASDLTVRVIILAAQGKAFCAGHDLKQMAALDLNGCTTLFNQCSKLMLTIQKLPQPVIARVQGIATAAGCQLVAACDLAVAASDARFAVSGINVGLFCATPAVALTRNLPRKQAMEMLLTGDFIDADTALARGLVNRVAPLDMLDVELAKLAAAIAAKPAAALAMGKQLFYQQLEMGIGAAYQLAGQTMACNMMDAAAQEGVQAFIEKRRN